LVLIVILVLCAKPGGGERQFLTVQKPLETLLDVFYAFVGHILPRLGLLVVLLIGRREGHKTGPKIDLSFTA